MGRYARSHRTEEQIARSKEIEKSIKEYKKNKTKNNKVSIELYTDFDGKCWNTAYEQSY